MESTNNVFVGYSFEQSVFIEYISSWWVYSCENWSSAGCEPSHPQVSELFMTNNNSWISGPVLPEYTNTTYKIPYFTCAAQINSTHTMVTGGSLYGVPISETRIFNWVNYTWSFGPNMTNPRTSHMCINLGP